MQGFPWLRVRTPPGRIRGDPYWVPVKQEHTFCWPDNSTLRGTPSFGSFPLSAVLPRDIPGTETSALHHPASHLHVLSGFLCRVRRPKGRPLFRTVIHPSLRPRPRRPAAAVPDPIPTGCGQNNGRTAHKNAARSPRAVRGSARGSLSILLIRQARAAGVGNGVIEGPGSAVSLVLRNA